MVNKHILYAYTEPTIIMNIWLLFLSSWDGHLPGGPCRGLPRPVEGFRQGEICFFLHFIVGHPPFSNTSGYIVIITKWCVLIQLKGRCFEDASSKSWLFANKHVVPDVYCTGQSIGMCINRCREWRCWGANWPRSKETQGLTYPHTATDLGAFRRIWLAGTLDGLWKILR